MVDPSALLAVAVIALGMAVLPGPNVIYLVSRTVEEGRRSGLIALGGVGIGYLLHLTATVLGLSAALAAAPELYFALHLVGAAYLAWLAWRALRASGISSAAARQQSTTVRTRPTSPIRLILMGTLTNVLNPKAPLMYLSLIPQFINLEKGGVAAQAAVLGGTHIVVSLAAHVCLLCGAGGFAAFLERKPSWLRAQRYATAALLGVFAAELVVSAVATALPWSATPERIEAAPQATASPAATPRSGKYYIVGPPLRGQREHLYSIAVKTLGDGRRHRELSALNHNRSQPDGRRMTDPLVVEPGWVLLLPGDARGGGVLTGAPPQVTAAPGPASPAAGTVSPRGAGTNPAMRAAALVLGTVPMLVVGTLLLRNRSDSAAAGRRPHRERSATPP